MGIESLPCFIAGQVLEPEDRQDTPSIQSFDGSTSLKVRATKSGEIRTALRFAEKAQERLAKTTIEERVEVATLLLKEYAKQKWTLAKYMGLFRGQVARDTYWMCDLIAGFGDELDPFLEAIFGAGGNLVHLSGRYGSIHWKSKGVASMYCAATMDGPPNITAMCHGIISGTHMIIRPSWRDSVTHLAFEILYKHGHHDYAQLVRWPSDSAEGALNNKSLLLNVTQSLIFSSEENYQALINSAAEKGSESWQMVMRKSRRYGTGLPLNIVTENADLDKAAQDLVAGARLGGGRFCLSTTPVLVAQSVYKDLVDNVIDRAKALRVGDVLDPQTDLSAFDPSEASAVMNAIGQFGGNLAHGKLHERNSDVMVLRDVPHHTSSMFREIGATVLSLIPMPKTGDGVQLAKAALGKNHREAWTALSVHGNYDEFNNLKDSIPTYRALLGGVVAEGKLLLPHQGTYFILDLMRRTTVEDIADGQRVRTAS